MTQSQFVKFHLLKNGSISRNFALNNFITRLGAIIYNLKKEGWVIETQKKDYITCHEWARCDCNYICKRVPPEALAELENKSLEEEYYKIIKNKKGRYFEIKKFN